MRIILSDPAVTAVLFNIFGGITRCDEVAKGILVAMDEVKPKVPMVVRLVGTNAEEGRKLLENANMITADVITSYSIHYTKLYEFRSRPSAWCGKYLHYL